MFLLCPIVCVCPLLSVRLPPRKAFFVMIECGALCIMQNGETLDLLTAISRQSVCRKKHKIRTRKKKKNGERYDTRCLHAHSLPTFFIRFRCFSFGLRAGVPGKIKADSDVWSLTFIMKEKLRRNSIVGVGCIKSNVRGQTNHFS